MKIFLIIILSFPFSCVASTCAKEAAQAYLNQVKVQVSSISSCSHKKCIQNKVRLSERLLCEAQKHCENLSNELFYPCDQKMNLNHEDISTLHSIAPLHFREMLMNAQRFLNLKTSLVKNKGARTGIFH